MPGPPIDPGQARPELALTDLDRELLQQCRSESFYRRSLPFGAALCLATFWRHRLGHYQRFIVLRYIGSAVAGNILGRVSYIGACRQKFLDAEDGQSAVKAMMQKQQPLPGFGSPGSLWGPPPPPHQQQPQQKRDISLDNQPMVPDWSTPPPPQQQQSPAARPDYQPFGSSSDERYQQPSSNYYDDDDRPGPAKPPRLWDDDFKRRDT